MVAKCFYFSRNLFPSFGYGKLKCVFAVIWPYTWYMKVKIWGISGIVSQYQTPLRGKKRKEIHNYFQIKEIFDGIRISDWRTSPKHPNLWLVRFDPTYGDPQNGYLYKTQGHPATIFCKITVRRSKYCQEISNAWEKLKISG